MKHSWWDQEFRKLVTFGESTTAGGWSSCQERCWASLLAQQINEYQRVPIQLVNSGIGGNVISQKSPGYDFSGKPAANERINKHVIEHNPDLLIISYGLNDSRSGTPSVLFCEEMKDLICRVREHIKPLIVLLGVYYVSNFEIGGPRWQHGNLNFIYEYSSAIKQIAQQSECLFVDLLESYREADWLIHYDCVHANDLGHRIVANKIFEVLASNCSGLALETKQLEKEIKPWRDESVLVQDYGY